MINAHSSRMTKDAERSQSRMSCSSHTCSHVKTADAVVDMHDDATPEGLRDDARRGIWHSPNRYQRMLFENFIIDPCCGGYFSLDPESGAAIFKLRHPLAALATGKLPVELAVAIHTETSR